MIGVTFPGKTFPLTAKQEAAMSLSLNSGGTLSYLSRAFASAFAFARAVSAAAFAGVGSG